MSKPLVRFLQSVVALVFIGASAVATAQEPSNPHELLGNVAMRTFEAIKSQHDEIQKDPATLRDIMVVELLPHIDYQYAALKVLGRNFKKVPREKLPIYIDAFKEYLITTYAIALSQYDDQEVIIVPGKVDSEDKIVTVKAIIRDDNRPDINLIFQVRRSSKTGEWKAFDMIVEGISLLSSKQSELEPVLTKDGVDGVIAILEEKNKQPIRLQQKDNDE